jgi:shikimate 5-dehydrogenase
MRRAAVLGSPVEHSLSPVLHRAAYAELGLAGWSYEAIECAEAELPAFLEGLDASWAGLSLTMPLKRVALRLLDEVTELAMAVGGANTVVFEGERRRGFNTDVYGIVTALAEAGVGLSGPPATALVLGGGATAGSALAALAEMREIAGETAREPAKETARQPEVTLAVRTPARAAEAVAAAGRLGVPVTVRTLDELDELLDVDLVMSTLPAGAADPYANRIAASGAAVFDVVYAPWPTRLAAAVVAAGGSVVGGFEMLLHQAVRQVALMTGRPDVPVEAMRAAGLAELARRERAT